MNWSPRTKLRNRLLRIFSFLVPTLFLNTSIPGCTESATDSIEIVVNPVPEIDQFTISADSICLGEEVTVSSTVNPIGGTFSWTPGTIGLDSIVQFEPISLGYNSFTLNYELNGCSVEDSIDVFVNPIPLVECFRPLLFVLEILPLLSARADIPSGGDYVWYDGSFTLATGSILRSTPTGTTQITMYNTHPYKCAQMIRHRLLYMHLKFL